MGYVKYSAEQLAERERAKVAIAAAKAHLKGLREAKKAKKDYVITLRRQLKAEIKRRKEAAAEAKKAEKELKALKKRCRPILVVLRKVYKPFLVARRKVERLKKAKAKAEALADRKAAREAAKEAKLQLELKAAQERIAKAAETRAADKPEAPKPEPVKTEAPKPEVPKPEPVKTENQTYGGLSDQEDDLACSPKKMPNKKKLKTKPRPPPIVTNATPPAALPAPIAA